MSGERQRPLTHLSLFSGIGGLDLAAEWAGFRTVGQCEWAHYPTKVLEKHWPDVPRWRDIRTLTGESFHERTGLRTVDVVSGGFPCQPFSTAGKRKGKEDDRYLWPELFRVIQEIRPAWFVGENVAGIVTMALDTVLSDLETIGYTAQAFIIPACAVDAPHRRNRCAIVAYSEKPGNRGLSIQPGETRSPGSDPDRSGAHVANANDRRGSLRKDRELPTVKEVGGSWGHIGGEAPEHGSGEWRASQSRLGGGHDGLSAWLDGVRDGWADGTWESGIPRIATGIPDRAARLKCLGNAVVPQQFYPVFQAIHDIEVMQSGQ